MDIKWLKFLPKKNQWWIVLLIGILFVVIATPTKIGTKEDEKNSYSTELEERLEELLGNMKNVGNVKVMITSKKSGEVEGVVVLAEGANNAVVVRNITDVVQALFQVDVHKIKVIEKKIQKQEESL